MKFKNEQKYITLNHSLRKDLVRILPQYIANHLLVTQHKLTMTINAMWTLFPQQLKLLNIQWS